MHSLDGLIHVLGDFDEVKAEAAVRRSKIELSDRRGAVRNTVPDHIALSGRLQSGAIASVYFRGGTSGAGNFRWEINGSKGDLLLTASNGNIQVADLDLRCGRAGAILDERPVAATHNAMTDNVKRLYQAIAVDMRTGSRSAPDFTVAAARHRLLAAIEESART
jgi:predicted dehydrogenase